MKKKEYVAPKMEVVKMELQGCLLAGSQQQNANSVELGTLEGFEDYEE